MMRTWLLVLLGWVFSVGAVVAQPAKEYVSLEPGIAKVGNDCSGGVRYDDGSFESGYKFNSFLVSTGSYAMSFDVPPGSPGLTSVCVCWVRDTSETNTAIAYAVKVWAADGPNGTPGTLLGQAVGNAQGVGFSPGFFRTDLLIPVSGTRVWIGPEWHPSSASLFYLCSDENGPTTQPAYRSQSTAAPNENLQTVFPNYHTLGVRAEFAAAGTCIPSDTALCLNHGRFKVEATFQAAGQAPGTAHVVKLTDETGYLWFFSSVNVEAVIKVIDACSFNQRFWVYAGGLTDVQVTLTVTDTKNGTVRTYTNPQGAKFQPIQDSSAFATCP